MILYFMCRWMSCFLSLFYGLVFDVLMNNKCVFLGILEILVLDVMFSFCVFKSGFNILILIVLIGFGFNNKKVELFIYIYFWIKLIVLFYYVIYFFCIRNFWELCRKSVVCVYFVLNNIVS